MPEQTPHELQGGAGHGVPSWLGQLYFVVIGCLTALPPAWRPACHQIATGLIISMDNQHVTMSQGWNAVPVY